MKLWIAARSELMATQFLDEVLGALLTRRSQNCISEREGKAAVVPKDRARP